MSRLPEDVFLTEAHFREVWTELRAPSELAILTGLTVLEMCLVIACKHLQVNSLLLFVYVFNLLIFC